MLFFNTLESYRLNEIKTNHVMAILCALKQSLVINETGMLFCNKPQPNDKK